MPTTAGDLLEVLADARRRAGPRGRVVWLQESTTGWARVRELVGKKAEFVLANVLQMPLPPKGRRKKTDKVDTARLQREYLNGAVPLAHQPPAWWRQVLRSLSLAECSRENPFGGAAGEVFRSGEGGRPQPLAAD